MVNRSTSLRNLLELFKGFHTLPLIPVVDEEKHLIGVVHLTSLVDVLKSQETKFFKNIPFVEIEEGSFWLKINTSYGRISSCG